jgi:tetratricopeptide (TPR) repeat protein
MTDLRADLPNDRGDDQRIVEHCIATLLQNDRIAPAKVHLLEALRRFPNSEGLVYFRAFIELREGNDASARRTIAQLLTAAPDHHHGRRLLAVLEERRGRIADAERLWESLIKQRPGDAELLGLYALFLIRTQHRFEAAEIAERGIKINPQDRHCLWALAICEVLDNPWEPSHPRFEALLQASPEWIATGKTLVLSLETQGRIREALQVAQRLLTDWPHSVELVCDVQRLKLKTHWIMFPLWPFISANREVAGAFLFGLMMLVLTWPTWYDKWAAPIINVLLAAVLVYVVLGVVVIRLLYIWAITKARRS